MSTTNIPGMGNVTLDRGVGPEFWLDVVLISLVRGMAEAGRPVAACDSFCTRQLPRRRPPCCPPLPLGLGALSAGRLIRGGPEPQAVMVCCAATVCFVWKFLFKHVEVDEDQQWDLDEDLDDSDEAERASSTQTNHHTTRTTQRRVTS